MKHCRGCGKKHAIAMFAVSQDLEVECKKVYDRLWQMARRQGQLEWFKSVYHDDDRLKHLISRFRDATVGTTKKNVFKFAEYREKFCAKTAVMQDDEGEMMEEDEFTTHMVNRHALQPCHVPPLQCG